MYFLYYAVPDYIVSCPRRQYYLLCNVIMWSLCAGTGPLASAPPYILCSAFLLSWHCTPQLYNIKILHLLGHSMIAVVFGAVIKITHSIIFVVAPCMSIVLSPLFVQLMHTNYYKIVKQLKSFKIITVAPKFLGLHKPSSGSSQACASLKLQCWLRLHIFIWSYWYCGCIFCLVLLCVWIVQCVDSICTMHDPHP